VALRSRRMVRRVLTILGFCTLASLTACGGGNGGKANQAPAGASTTISLSTTTIPLTTGPAAAAAQQFTVKESAWTVSSSSGGTVYIRWVAVLHNPNSNLFGTFPTITATARSASGQVLGTSNQVLYSLPPGADVAAASQLSATAQPTTVEFTAGDVKWASTTTTAANYKPFTASGVSVSKSYSTLTANGELQNPYNTAFDQLAAVVLLRDSTGKLVGGDVTFVSHVPAAGKVPFTISYIAVPQAPYTNAQVLAEPWGALDNWEQAAQFG
jgi:hypothetical protein